jgi:hypothetical protein
LNTDKYIPINTLNNPTIKFGRDLLMHIMMLQFYGGCGDAKANAPVIAGGFVRDAIYGKDWRDIDLYVPLGQFDPMLEALADRAKLDTADIIYPGPEEDEYKHQYISRHAEVTPNTHLLKMFPTFLLGKKIDIIEIQHPALVTADGITDAFNLGMNAAAIEWNTKGGDLFITSEFQDDMQRGTISLLRTDWGRFGTAKNIKKLFAKYGDRHLFYHNEGPIDFEEFEYGSWKPETNYLEEV